MRAFQRRVTNRFVSIDPAAHAVATAPRMTYALPQHTFLRHGGISLNYARKHRTHCTPFVITIRPAAPKHNEHMQASKNLCKQKWYTRAHTQDDKQKRQHRHPGEAFV